jgi:hypothetical protein
MFFLQAASHGHDHDHHGHKHDHHEHKGHAHEHEHEGGLPEGMAGLVLVIGFLAMLLLDHLQHAFGGSCGAPGHSHAHGTSRSHAHGTSCSTGQETQRGRSPSPRAKGGKKAAVADDSSAAKTAPAPGSEAATVVPATDCTGKAKKGEGTALLAVLQLLTRAWRCAAATSPRCPHPQALQHL